MTEGQNTAAERPNRIPWPPLLILATVIAAFALGWFAPLPWPGLDDLPARAVGIGLGVAGLALMVWASATLTRHNTTVLPHKGTTTLVTSGPYAWFRNPLYLSDVLIFMGAAEITKNIWFVILIPVFVALVTWLAILPEEKHLEAKFGDEYTAYKAKARRWI